MTRTVVDGQTITTNNRERELVTIWDVPEPDRNDFDYLDEADAETPRFFRFRDSWWDAHEFVVAPDSLKARGWDGVMTTSYWDAIVLRYFDRDGYELEGVVVGHATW